MAGSVREVWQIIYKSLCCSTSRCCSVWRQIQWGAEVVHKTQESIGERYSFTEVISYIRHCVERVANSSANWQRQRHCGKRLIICNIRRMQRHFRFPLSRLALTATQQRQQQQRGTGQRKGNRVSLVNKIKQLSVAPHTHT